MYRLIDPSLNPHPQSRQAEERRKQVKEARSFAESKLGKNVPQHAMSFLESALVDGPSRKHISGTPELPYNCATFQTDRDAEAAPVKAKREGFDPFASVGYLQRVESLTRKAQTQDD